jgi:uncharacterized protein DUF1553/uncharacterized protein DUF1549/concanavalin A-like lectin/glucanase superfamily protein/cytochrome c
MLVRLLAAGSACAFLQGQTVDFNRDVRPIVSDKCYTCHGPDEAKRTSKLRFDIESAAKADLGGRFAIVPGQPDKSELVRRITNENKALRMPPVYSGVSLTTQEIELLRRWIAEGAVWEKHWSLIPPKRPELPRVSDGKWARNGIDSFVLQRLDREGLRPSPEASKNTLIRRATLDLTGLPPTPVEVDAFLSDQSPNAYEKVVDRLLASPRYAERMAIRWLDAARYADTNGYQTDAERFMWRWRDWVIEAFHKNMPFDQFTIEQIAGDLLPNATLSQKIATGFNRNHRGNGEGGIIAEEYAVEYVVDRVDTTATVWLGATMGCARCHDHKYDPLTQKEYYRAFAYFNNVPERGKAFKYGNSPPFIPAPTPQQEDRLKELDRKLDEADRAFSAVKTDAERAQREWEKTLGAAGRQDWTISHDLILHGALDGDVPGKVGGATKFDGQRSIEAGDVANLGFYDKFTFAAWIYPEAETGAIVTRAQDVSEGDGYGMYLKDGRVQLNLVLRWLDDALRVETERKIELNRWQHVAVSYDGTRLAEGVRFYIDGKPEKLRVLVDELNQEFRVKQPVRIGAGLGPENRFRGLIDEVRIYQAVLTPEEASVVAEAVTLDEIAAGARRTKAQSDKIAWAFLDKYAPESMQQSWKRLNDSRRARAQFADSIPTVMVMKEREIPRDTFLLVRGAYDRPGEKLKPGVPAALPPLPRGAPNNRLGFAKWLVDPANPRTSRVTVNRFWQMYFGNGIVKTTEDFGSQGEWPTHPELLDWLATEFVRTGWDVKAMQKLIVTSATYRQSSRLRPELVQRDPDNRLLAHGPRLRLPAEAVRDQALAISGLLVEKIGGPSVKPYQPAGLWKELSGGADYKPDKGENLYRRSLYTFWKRASPPPFMMTFDSAGREACSVRETRTNTPLQALNLMNDVTYVESARGLAQRMMKEGGATPADRIALAFRLALARQPSTSEAKLLASSFHHHLDTYQTDRAAALKLVSQGESARDEKLDVSELAAYMTIASMILNLDETVTKE